MSSEICPGIICCDPDDYGYQINTEGPVSRCHLLAIEGVVDLRTLSHADLDIQFLDFLDIYGDGQGAWYIFSDIATNPDDGIDWIKPNDISSSDPGRWYRTNNP